MMHIPSLGPQCPWYGLSEMAKPNIKWCESPVCGWISEPTNTWSNMAYFIMAMFMLNYVRKSKNKSVMMFVPAMIFVGATSFIYHASYTFVFQFFDFLGMFVFLGLPIIFNLRRVNLLKKSKQMIAFFSVLVIGSATVLGFYFTGIPIQSIVAVLVVGLIGSEIYAYKKSKTKPVYKNYFIAIGSITSAATFSVLDATRTMCSPNSIIQGHAIWHCLSAIALFFLFKFYSQFNFEEEVVNIILVEKVTT